MTTQCSAETQVFHDDGGRGGGVDLRLSQEAGPDPRGDG